LCSCSRSPPFRPFRIFVGIVALCIAALIVAVAISNRGSEEREKATEAKQQIEREKSAERQRLRWSRIAPSEVELRDRVLNRKQMQLGDSEFTLTASIKNNSDVLLSGFEILVAVSDCKSGGDCERIGEATEMEWTDIPAHQARAISGPSLSL
jgi:hypothetical protein